MYFNDLFEKHGELFGKLGINPDNGFGALLEKLQTLPSTKRAEIEADIAAIYAARPPLAMVDSDKGITNLHVPSDIIIDASMPAAIRASGKMWGPDGKLHDMLAMIPDRCYAGIYQVVIDDCRDLGAYDVPTMGNVSNIGLMAQAAEEYGSHDKTFQMADAGTVRVDRCQRHGGHAARSQQGRHLAHVPDQGRRHPRLGQAGREPRACHGPAGHLLARQPARLRPQPDRAGPRSAWRQLDTTGLDIRILSPVEAIRATLQRVRAGQDTISVTGNVLRDYLTDLFPILELGTSAKMLSIVPLLEGGGLYETGAGGSAPKHVQQFLEEDHLRWDSLGEFLALQVSIEDLGAKTGNPQGARSWPMRWMSPMRSSSRPTSPRHARWANWTCAAATSTWRCTGPRRWRRRTATRS